jgi:hypothetical protein
MAAGRSLLLALPVFALAACGSRTGLVIPGEPPPGDNSGDDIVDTCPDAAATLVYLISSQNDLLSFDPPTGTITTIGQIACPDPGGFQPFSMAVDRAGIAYVAYGEGNLFRVSTADASCRSTAFVPGAGGFPLLFGMGYSRDAAGSGETLFIAGTPGYQNGSSGPAVLASVDTTTFAIDPIATISPDVIAPELTGSAAAQLFAFYATGPSGTSSAIGEVSTTSAELTPVASLPTVDQGSAWAFALWGGDFYLFTAPGGDDTSSVIQRYSPSDGSVVQVGTASVTIVGAGVSTCAPAM